MDIYINHIKKLNPEIEEEELNVLSYEFNENMKKQWDSITEQWVKVVANTSA
jgi:hypothetical protein